MSQDKKEKDLLKAYEISSEPHDFTPDVAAGKYRFILLLVFLILGIVIALVVFRVLSVKLKQGPGQENSKNPLFYVGQEENDDSLPDIPGARVYDVRKDVNDIENDMDSQRKEFKEELNDDSLRKQNPTMESKDKFAAERLELLKKIDQAKTREERIKAIKELENLAGGEN